MSFNHQFDPTILREYDVRGIVGDSLNDADAHALGRVFGTIIARDGGQQVVVGYDGRDSSPGLADAVIAGLTQSGVSVRMIGLGPTPMLYYAVHELGADGGVMVTGSHNPPDYNGFKMMLGKKPFFGDMIQKLGQMAAGGDVESGKGSVRTDDIFQRYIERLLRDFDGSSLDVAWDPGNGAAGEAVSTLVRHLPGHHVVINGDIDSRFPNHHPDPTVEENLEQLKTVVKTQGLQLGLAFDGDGDRIGAVDVKGRVVWGDQILLILARSLLKELPNSTIIADVKASRALFDGIADAGGVPLMWKTGHSLIKEKMAQTGAPLAGEMSGHIFYKHRFYGHDDALYAGLRFLEAVAAQGGDLAALYDHLPQFVNTPELRFPCSEARKWQVVDEVRARLAKSGADMVDVDGVRVNTKDGWWLLRASNTQDVLVARAEAYNGAGLARLKNQLRTELEASAVEPPSGL